MTFKTLKDVKAGDTIYVYDRYRSKLTTTIVDKVGRKYITAFSGTKFTFDGWEVSDYYATKFAYADKAQYDAELHRGFLEKSVTSFLGYCNTGLRQLNVNQLERIVEILKEST